MYDIEGLWYFQTLGQRDQRWAQVNLGNSSVVKIGTDGCLLTCFAMLADTDPVTMNELRKKTGGFGTGQYAAYAMNFDIQNVAPRVKLIEKSPEYWGPVPANVMDKIRADLKAGYTFILLVDPTPLVPGIAPGDTHFVLAVDVDDQGHIQINDPWFGDKRPLSPYYGKDDAAAIYVYYKYEVTRDPKGNEDTGTPMFAVHGDGHVRLRSAPAMDAPVIGAITSGDIIEGAAITNGWLSVPLLARPNVTVRTDEANVKQQVGYMYAPLLVQVSGKKLANVTIQPTPAITPKPPAPPVNTPPLLGVNVIGNAALAWEAAQDGCRFFVIVDNPGMCEKIKANYPDAVVINRRWVNWQINGKEFYAKFGSLGGGIFNEIYNEQDSWSYDTPANLKNRIEWEFQYADLAEKKGHLIMAGAYSNGCPDWTRQDICDTFKTYFAPRYNTDPNLSLSFHLYAPNLPHIYKDEEILWYETRYDFAFTKGGLDPSLRKIYCSETGIDQGSVGGFKALNASPAVFKAWCDRWQTIQSRPLVVNGVSYQRPLVGAAIYDYTNGSDSHWIGYDTYAFRDIYKGYWRK